jgi:RNA polymerase sigma-70 factor, ECF subfamily
LLHFADEELLERIGRGDSRAFAELYERYALRLYSYCLRLLRDSQSAEDVVQETLTKVYTGVHSVHDARSFRGWIFTIARNEAYGILRKNRTAPLGDDDLVWDRDTPLESLLQAEENEIVQHLLEELKPEYREVLLLREYENLSYEEIAAISSSTIGAVKSRLYKARQALVKKLEPIYKVRE